MAEKKFETPKRARFSRVLGNKNFLFLWLDQLMSLIADRLLLYALLILIFNLSQSNLAVSFPMLAFGVSAVIFGPSAGVFIDRWDKKMVMVLSNILRGLLILLIIPLASQSIFWVFMISFIIFAISQFFAPAEASSIPLLVEKRDLIAANSLFMMTMMIASVVGIGLAAPLTNFFGITFVLGTAAFLHLLSTLSTLMIELKHKGRPASGSLPAIFQELLVGLEFIRRKPAVKSALAKLFIATSVLAIICLLAVDFSENVLNIGAANFGYLIFATGGGMILGGIFLGRYGHRAPKNSLATLGFLLAGVSLLLLAATANLWLVLPLIFILGIANACVVSPLQTILHEKVPKTIRGRVFGVQNMFISSAFTFPVVLFGKIADLIGLHQVLILLGTIILASGLIDLKAQPKTE